MNSLIEKNDIANKSDEDLVNLTLENQEFYLYLMERYEKKLKRYAKRISGLDEKDIEDILQNVFIKVYLNLNDFDGDLKFSSWIYRITHNEVISNYRKFYSKIKIVDAAENDKLLERICSNIDIEKEIDLSYVKENVNKILAGMNEKYREVLVLRYLEEKDYKEISDILKKPIGTIATLINRAKTKFQQEAEKKNINF